MKIKVGLAGFGLSGQVFQAPFLHQSDKFELVKVLERSSQKSKEEYPYVKVVDRFQELLTDEIELVVISTPHEFHVSMAKEAMAAGKHVVVEKPVAPTAEEARELWEFSKSQGVLFTVFQNRRLDGDFQTVKKLIDEGILGDVVDYEAHYDRFVVGESKKPWKAINRKGNGILYDLGVHIVDQAVYLFGMPTEVYGDFSRQRKESVTDDNIKIILTYEDKRVVLSASEVVVGVGPHYSVHGRKGSFQKYGMDVQEEALIRGERPGKPSWGEDEKENYGVLTLWDGGKSQVEKVKTIQGDYGKYYDNLYEVIRHKGQLLVKPEQVIKVLEIIEAAAKSNEEKRRIVLF